ncbi:hypothetical protein M8C21_018821, partial [Ambrosia artemisiifolia]
MCSEAMLALLGMSRVQLVEGKEPVAAAPGMSKFDAFLARDKAPLEWREPAEGRVSVIDQMVDRFYFPYLEFKPSGMIISREHPINPDPLCSVPHVTTPYFVVSSDEESTGSSVELVHPPTPRGRKKSTPRAHKHKVLSQVKSAPLSAGGEGPYFGQREGRVESSSSAPEDVDVPETPLKKTRKLGKVQSGKSGSSRSEGWTDAVYAGNQSAAGAPSSYTEDYEEIVSPKAPGSSSGPTPSEVEIARKRQEAERALAEAEKARAEKEAAEAEKRANEAAAKKAEAERAAAEKLRLEEIAKKAEEEKAAVERLRLDKEKAEAEAKAKSDEEATRVASKQVLSESSPRGGSDTGVVGQVGDMPSGGRSSVERSDPSYSASDEFVSQVVPPKERQYQDSLARSQLITDICVGQALQIAAVESLKRRDEEFALDIAEFNSRRSVQAQREEKLKSDVERYRERAYKSEDKVKALERDHALAQKRWTEACQVTNLDMMRLKEQIQVLRNENSKLQETAEGLGEREGCADGGEGFLGEVPNFVSDGGGERKKPSGRGQCCAGVGPRVCPLVAAIAAAARAAGEAEGFDTGFYHALNQGRISE